jgi:nitrate reductase assembly molybdenum cofactor insertion protein NarJ
MTDLGTEIQKLSGPEVFLARGFHFASAIASYPQSDLGDTLGWLDDELVDAGELPGVNFNLVSKKIAEQLKDPSKFADWQSEYIDLFDRGKQENSLYETEYGRSRTAVKGNQLIDIGGFYKAFGFDFGGEDVRTEMLDHVAVQLEFYSLLLLKTSLLRSRGDDEGVKIVMDGRRKFLHSHLSRFVGAICERPGVKNSPHFSEVFGFCRDLVLTEAHALGVQVEEVDWITTLKESDPKGDEVMECGACEDLATQ